MRQLTITGLLWLSAAGCGLMGGVYFAFSAFVMGALGRIAPDHGVAAMDAINTGIVRSAFMPLFLGTVLASGALAVWAVVRRQEPGALWMLGGGVIYIAGMLLVTMLINVPLNNALGAAYAQGDAGSVWTRYLGDWTLWNHVRTLASTVAALCYVAAIVARA